MFRDFAPARPKLFVKLQDKHVFVKRPLFLDDFWVEVMVPAFTTLLTDTAREEHGNFSPVFGAIGKDGAREKLILFLGPGGANHVTPVTQFEVAFVALDLGLAKILADATPRIFSEPFDLVQKLGILHEERRVSKLE